MKKNMDDSRNRHLLPPEFTIYTIGDSLKLKKIYIMSTLLKIFSRRTVALRENILLTDRRATVPPIVKTVYLLRRKSCARFKLNFPYY